MKESLQFLYSLQEEARVTETHIPVSVFKLIQCDVLFLVSCWQMDLAVQAAAKIRHI